eukprot:GHVL01044753.1.p2 GENE.GHVL01044753.1~~GHVL01044753.1.p2  ORF type:complete len:276 (+),score=21.81 GHVL01044753.1:54-881(+)
MIGIDELKFSPSLSYNRSSALFNDSSKTLRCGLLWLQWSEIVDSKSLSVVESFAKTHTLTPKVVKAILGHAWCLYERLQTNRAVHTSPTCDQQTLIFFSLFYLSFCWCHDEEICSVDVASHMYKIPLMADGHTFASLLCQFNETLLEIFGSLSYRLSVDMIKKSPSSATTQSSWSWSGDSIGASPCSSSANIWPIRCDSNFSLLTESEMCSPHESDVENDTEELESTVFRWTDEFTDEFTDTEHTKQRFVLNRLSKDTLTFDEGYETFQDIADWT